MILGYHALEHRIKELFPKALPDKIGAASVDVSIGYTARTEIGADIDLGPYHEDNPFYLYPNQFLLVATHEHVHVPRDLSAAFYLKSTRARQGYGHALAAWIDPGWSGILTMELKNYNENTRLALWPGMPIGQLVFMQTVLAGNYHGRYQGDVQVQGPLPEIHYDAGERP